MGIGGILTISNGRTLVRLFEEGTWRVPLKQPVRMKVPHASEPTPELTVKNMSSGGSTPDLMVAAWPKHILSFVMREREGGSESIKMFLVGDRRYSRSERYRNTLSWKPPILQEWAV